MSVTRIDCVLCKSADGRGETDVKDTVMLPNTNENGFYGEVVLKFQAGRLNSVVSASESLPIMRAVARVTEESRPQPSSCIDHI